MADDIVSFGMEIDSSAAVKARQDLNRLAQPGPAVEQALNRLKGAEQAGADGVSAISQATKAVDREMQAARSSAVNLGNTLRTVFAGVGVMQVTRIGRHARHVQLKTWRRISRLPSPETCIVVNEALACAR